MEDYETFLLDELLLEDKHEITTKSLKNKFRTRNHFYHGRFQKFKRMIKDKSTEMEYFDKSSHTVSNISMGLGILLIFFGFFGGRLVSNYLSVNVEIFVMSLVPVGLLYVFGQKALRRRTTKGAEEFSKWKAFRSYLKDFSNLKEYGPDSIVIWEHFLVYATLFGFSTIVLRALKIVVPKILDVNNGVLLGPALFLSGSFEYKGFNKEMSAISSISRSLSRSYSSSNRRYRYFNDCTS